jgi:hypothetical protein
METMLAAILCATSFQSRTVFSLLWNAGGFRDTAG